MYTTAWYWYKDDTGRETLDRNLQDLRQSPWLAPRSISYLGLDCVAYWLMHEPGLISVSSRDVATCVQGAGTGVPSRVINCALSRPYRDFRT
jgi:hypothetical protein